MAFVLEGHRGACGLSPENTLAGVATALEIGVTTLELDVGVTLDDAVVVLHDHRLSQYGPLLRDLTLAEIPPSVPTLSEVFQLLDDYGADGVELDIEAKTDPTVDETHDPVAFAQVVLEVVRRHDGVERSLLQSFDWRTLAAARRELPALRTQAIASALTIYPGTPWTDGVEIAEDAWSRGTLAAAVAEAGACRISASHPEITDALIDEAHRLGLAIVGGTVNDQAAMLELIDRGVDGIVTDFPDLGRRALARRGLPLPPRYAAPQRVVAATPG